MVNQPLFDNRYRYDHIYPRGRSGETLRAVDTYNHDRPVVIKRPAPQDAPPLRAAQEASILTEKRALERLSGHPVITELRASSTFRVGGTTHHYIVMDRADGEIVEHLILENKKLPELELLVIMDNLLNLLAEAHAQHVIYNDVDAKHLFWNRESYRLKVIDWGNAILKDEPNAPASIAPTTDIFQVGELLYFLYQGGARLNHETSAEGEYRVIFNGDVPEMIQEIITRATHPNIKTRRYASIRALREALNKYRQPMEQARNQSVKEIQAELVPDAPQKLLERLEAELSEVLALDPGYPPARQLQQEVRLRLRHLAVQADFEAARIYIDTGNWPRALRLIEELIPDADPYMRQALQFLAAAVQHFQAQQFDTPPDDFASLMNQILEGHPQAAAAQLMTVPDKTNLLLAERLAALLPDVLLLRPHFVRLENELKVLNPNLADELSLMPRQLDAKIESGFGPLIERYSKIAIHLSDILPQLEEETENHQLDAEILLRPLERAEDAARAILSHLRRLSETALSQPNTARVAWQQAQSIDPTSQAIEAVPTYIAQVEKTLTELAQFQPSQDYKALEIWLEQAQGILYPYTQDITDPQFQKIAQTFADTLHQWRTVEDMLTLGRKRPVVRLLQNMAQAIRPMSASLANWFEQSARLIKDADIVEKFSPNPNLGDILLEGYRAWDGGQSGKAADSARRAAQIAVTEGELFAVERLQKLAEITNRWLTEGGVNAIELTQAAEIAVLALFLPDEKAEYDRFNQQMPSEETYLKAMRLGIVAHMRESSTAAFRALFLYYALSGMLAIQEDKLDEADFWRETMQNTDDRYKTHPMFTTFDTALTRRKLVLRAEGTLNAIRSFDDLPEAKRAVNAPLAEEWLKDAQQGLNALEAMRGHWADGDFRAAREDLNTAIENIQSAEKSGGMKLTPLLNFISPYRESAGELIAQKQIVEQAAMEGSLESNPAVPKALENLVRLSEATMGAEYARQVKLWRDMYSKMVRTHHNYRLSKREKIAEFEMNFSALFIEKHPAYRLFQRWYEAARAIPDDEVEDLQIDVDFAPLTPDTPVYMESESIPEAMDEPIQEKITEIMPELVGEDDELPDPYAGYGERAGRGRRWNKIILGALVILLLIGVGAVFRLVTRDDQPVTRLEATATRVISALSAENATGTALAVLNSPTPRPTDRPTLRPTMALPTQTQVLPTETNQPTDEPTAIPTDVPSLTPTTAITIVTNTPPQPSSTPQPLPTTLIPPTEGVAVAIEEGTINALEVLHLISPDEYAWNTAFFSEGAGGIWQLGATVEQAGTAPIAVILPPDFLDNFDSNAALEIRRVEVTMELTVYDPTRVEDGRVYFGLGIQNPQRQRYGAEVQVRQAGLVSLGINENGTFVGRSQIPLQPVKVTMAFQRENDGSVSFYINGQRLGLSPNLYPLDEPMSIVLYNAGGGMFVSVSTFQLEFAP